MFIILRKIVILCDIFPFKLFFFYPVLLFILMRPVMIIWPSEYTVSPFEFHENSFFSLCSKDLSDLLLTLSEWNLFIFCKVVIWIFLIHLWPEIKCIMWLWKISTFIYFFFFLLRETVFPCNTVKAYPYAINQTFGASLWI